MLIEEQTLPVDSTSSAEVIELASALDLLAAGVLVVDGHLRVRHMNRYAKALLHAQDELYLDNGRLQARLAPITRALETLVATVDPVGGRMEALAVPRQGEQAPIEVLVAPVARAQNPARGARSAAIVFIRDPETCSPDVADVLHSLYGLTEAEGQIAGHLARGDDIREAGAAAGVSLATARTYLGRILRKTGTRGQSELMRRICSGLAALVHSHSEN